MEEVANKCAKKGVDVVESLAQKAPSERFCDVIRCQALCDVIVKVPFKDPSKHETADSQGYHSTITSIPLPTEQPQRPASNYKLDSTAHGVSLPLRVGIIVKVSFACKDAVHLVIWVSTPTTPA